MESAKTFTFRSRPTASAFDSFADYLAARTQGVESSLFELIRKRDRELGTGSKLPWPTFVLGSGCLATYPRRVDVDETLIDDLITHALDRLPVDLRRRSDVFHGAVHEFIRALNARKLDEDADLGWLIERSERFLANPEDTASDGRPDLHFAVLTALVAYLATRLYTEALNSATHVLDRSDEDEVEYELDTHPTMRTVHESIVGPLRAMVRSLRDPKVWRKGVSDSVGAYQALLGAFIDNLREDDVSRVFRSHIEVLSAFAWFFLTDETDIYPGWSDTLLFQATDMKGASEHFASMPIPRRPQLDVVSPLDETSWLYRRLERVTIRSWDERETDRDQFYESVAELLMSQSILIRESSRERPKDSRWPIPSAFVASFDIELEIALLSIAAAADTGIAVVIPVVHVSESLHYNTSVHWLTRIVHPSPPGATTEQRLSDLLAGGGWEEVGPDPREIDRFRGIPTVIHLAGAPLFALPGADRDVLPGGELRHALLLDEHIALVQLGAEISAYGRSLNPGFSADGRFADDAMEFGPGLRYWVTVGTQVADASVRLRLLTRELSQLRDPGGREKRLDKLRRQVPGAEITERFGVVVNQIVPTSERQVFLWQGFDVTTGHSGDLTPELRSFETKMVALAAQLSSPQETSKAVV